MSGNSLPILANISIEGETFALPVSAFDKAQTFYSNFAILYGCALGACIISILMLWMFSPRKNTPMFVLNQLTLIFMIIRTCLFLAYLKGPYASISYNLLYHGESSYERAFQVQTAASVIQIPLVTCIQISLIYQIFVIFKSQDVAFLKYFLTGFTSVLAVVVVTIYVYSNVVLYHIDAKDLHFGSWVSDLPFILFSTFVILSSSIFLVKLCLAIRSRRMLGLKQFNTFHILSISACQSMIIPSILLIIGFGTEVQYCPTIGMLLVVLSLPLTSMWAASANNSPTPTSSALAFVARTNSNSSDSSEGTAISSKYQYSFFPKLADSKNDLEKQNFHSPTQSVFEHTVGYRNLDVEKALDSTPSVEIPYEIQQIINESESHNLAAEKLAPVGSETTKQDSST